MLMLLLLGLHHKTKRLPSSSLEAVIVPEQWDWYTLQEQPASGR